MSKKKVRVLNAVVDGKERGEVLEVDAKTAKMLVANGYVEYVKEDKSKDDEKKDKKDAKDKKDERKQD